MAMNRLDVPRLNANEDQVLVVDVCVENGATVKQGDLLFVVESTKASSEVLAPLSGVVREISVAKEAMVDVGSLLCMVETEGGAAEVATEARDGIHKKSDGVRVTAKARLRAQQLGVDVDQIAAADGVIGVADVEAFAAKRTGEAGGAVAHGPTTLKAVIVGAGTHAAIIADALQGLGYDVIGATDPSLPVGTVVIPGISVIGNDDMLPALLEQGVRTAFIGVGGATENRIRRKIFDKLTTLGFFLPHAVSPAAKVGVGVALGPATYVMPGAVVGPRSRIGANVVVNTGCIICHDAVIHDHAHITPGAVLAGSVTVGESATVGMAATVLFQTKIGKNTLVHNNASVVGDIGDNFEFTRDGQRVSRS